MTTETHKLPAELWSALQSVCYEQDRRFLRDVSVITGIPEANLKSALLGRFGAPTTVLVEGGPWWTGSTCHFMERRAGGLWHPCGAYREAGGTCSKHTRSRVTGSLKRMEDPVFQTMKTCVPVRLGTEIVWVRDDGSAMTTEGVPLPLRVDVALGVAHEGLVDNHAEKDSE